MVSLTLSIMFGARTIAVLVPYISTSDFTVQNCTLLSIQKFKSKNKMTESACIKILANVQNRTTLIRRDEVDFKGACFSDCSLTIKRLRKNPLHWLKISFRSQKSAQIINPHWDSHNPMNNDQAMNEHLQEYFGLNLDPKSRFQCWAESGSTTSLLRKTISKRKAVGSCLWPISGVLTSIVLQLVTNARYKK